MPDKQSPFPGFTPDTEDPSSGFLVDPSGQTRHVFIKHSRNPERQATERTALTLVHARAAGPPVPCVVGEFVDDSGQGLVLSHEAGANLADLLSPTHEAPPRPAWYRPTVLPSLPSPRDLSFLLIDTGRAVRALHAIRLDKFGKLVGEEPNPHRSDGRAYTQQEIVHRIRMSIDKEFLSGPQAQDFERWFSRHIDCLSETEPACLIHYDLHSGNVRVYQDPTSGAWRLRVLFDFELARGWLPEWDLVYLQWELLSLSGDSGLAWYNFLEGYGPVDSVRLNLFEALRAMSAIAYGDRYPDWAAWSLARLNKLIKSSGMQ